MVDTVDKTTRSLIMAKVKSADTSPELRLRKALFALGLRYRLHRPNLPGKPDLVFSRYHAVVFVHGCFWHWHGCRRSRMPKSNTKYWSGKIARNQVRDQKCIDELLEKGWRVLIVWECALRPRLLSAAADLTADWLLDGKGIKYGAIEPTAIEKTAPPKLQLYECIR